MSSRILRGWLARADRLLRALEDGLLVVLLSGLILLASAQIVLRNVFSIGLAWADGSVRLAVLWIAVLGAVAAAREGRHIAIDVLARMLPATARKAAAATTALFTTSVCALLAWHSWRFVQESREFGDVLLDGWPAWPFQLVMPVGFALIALRYLLRVFDPGRGSDAGPGTDRGLGTGPGPGLDTGPGPGLTGHGPDVDTGPGPGAGIGRDPGPDAGPAAGPTARTGPTAPTAPTTGGVDSAGSVHRVAMPASAERCAAPGSDRGGD